MILVVTVISYRVVCCFDLHLLIMLNIVILT